MWLRNVEMPFIIVNFCKISDLNSNFLSIWSTENKSTGSLHRRRWGSLREKSKLDKQRPCHQRANFTGGLFFSLLFSQKELRNEAKRSARPARTKSSHVVDPDSVNDVDNESPDFMYGEADQHHRKRQVRETFFLIPEYLDLIFNLFRIENSRAGLRRGGRWRWNGLRGEKALCIPLNAVLFRLIDWLNEWISVVCSFGYSQLDHFGPCWRVMAAKV